jgi:hypothetical protein
LNKFVVEKPKTQTECLLGFWFLGLNQKPWVFLGFPKQLWMLIIAHSKFFLLYNTHIGDGVVPDGHYRDS